MHFNAFDNVDIVETYLSRLENEHQMTDTIDVRWEELAIERSPAAAQISSWNSAAAFRSRVPGWCRRWMSWSNPANTRAAQRRLWMALCWSQIRSSGKVLILKEGRHWQTC